MEVRRFRAEQVLQESRSRSKDIVVVTSEQSEGFRVRANKEKKTDGPELYVFAIFLVRVQSGARRF